MWDLNILDIVVLLIIHIFSSFTLVFMNACRPPHSRNGVNVFVGCTRADVLFLFVPPCLVEAVWAAVPLQSGCWLNCRVKWYPGRTLVWPGTPWATCSTLKRYVVVRDVTV